MKKPDYLEMARRQREAKAAALERGGDVRAAVKAAVPSVDAPKPPEPPVVVVEAPVVLARRDRREYMREYMAKVYRPRKRRKMVPGDLGLDSWPSTS